MLIFQVCNIVFETDRKGLIRASDEGLRYYLQGRGRDQNHQEQEDLLWSGKYYFEEKNENHKFFTT